MVQPQTARIVCSQCNAWYDSERELREHMETAHRGRGPEESSSPRDRTEVDREYDLFERLGDGVSAWRGVVSGHDNAIVKLKELAATTDNEVYLMQYADQLDRSDDECL